MALAAATHHSAQPNAALRGQKTGTRAREEVEIEAHAGPWGQRAPSQGTRPTVLLDPEPQERLVEAARAPLVLPTLAMPSLAGAGGEAVDAVTVAFLTWKAVEEKREDEQLLKMEEEKLNRQAKRVMEEDPEGWREAFGSDGVLCYWHPRSRRATWSLTPALWKRKKEETEEMDYGDYTAASVRSPST